MATQKGLFIGRNHGELLSCPKTFYQYHVANNICNDSKKSLVTGWAILFLYIILKSIKEANRLRDLSVVPWSVSPLPVRPPKIKNQKAPQKSTNPFIHSYIYWRYTSTIVISCHWCCAGLKETSDMSDKSWLCFDCRYLVKYHGLTKQTVEPSQQERCIRSNCILL